MTQIFKDNLVVPVTVLQVGPCFVAQIKTKDKDGYEAWQIGFGERGKMNKPQKGHLKDLGGLKNLKEFKSQGEKLNKEFSVGDKIEVSWFSEGDKVKVSAASKGKGFAGVVKRHGFAGGPKTHGQKHQHRAPGSIGGGFPERVVKGRRMAGRMGNDRVTIQSKVVDLDSDKNLLLIKGAVPGRKGALVSVIAK